jgi:hypothetical protein
MPNPARAVIGNGRRQGDSRPPRPQLPNSLIAAAEFLRQDPKGRRKLGTLGKAIGNAWQEKAQRVHQYHMVQGNGQLGEKNKPVPIDPTIRVTDAIGRPVGGVKVRFKVVGGGNVTQNVVDTGNDGKATCGTWTLGQGAGSKALEVKVTGKRVASFQAVAY